MANRIDSRDCIGCGECQLVCPINNISGTNEDVSEIDAPDMCPADCSACADVCPVSAIVLDVVSDD